MTLNDLVDQTLAKAAASGVGSLTANERLVFMIAEAETTCDMEGIDSLVESHSSLFPEEFAHAFERVGAREIAIALRNGAFLWRTI